MYTNVLLKNVDRKWFLSQYILGLKSFLLQQNIYLSRSGMYDVNIIYMQNIIIFDNKCRATSYDDMIERMRPWV